MHRVSVCVRGEWLRVPCGRGGPAASVRWLGSEALRRYGQAMRLQEEEAHEEVGVMVRRCQGGELLHPDDLLKDILEDNDFVQLVIEAEDPFPPATALPLTSSYKEPKEYMYLDGNSLTTARLVLLGKGMFKVKLTAEAEVRVIRARNVIETIITENRVVYGVNTGFGKFANILVPKEKLTELQANLVRSTCAGVGAPLSPERTRMLLALRINILAKGYSGVSMETVDAMMKAFNASCLSWVPEKGTVGASGDLAPLAHLTLGLMGEGRMWSPQTGWADSTAVLEGHGLTPLVLKPKEGIALINGTQMITSLGAEAVERALAVARQADIIAALTVEALKGTTKAFHSAIHAVRPHPGQMEVAKRMCSLLDSEVFPSQISESHRSCERVQDAYTLRCIPQVHGVVKDTIAFVQTVISTEMNSATDNPLVFAESGETMSGGNFHGEYPAKKRPKCPVAPQYLSGLLHKPPVTRNLWSTNLDLLSVPKAVKRTFGDGAVLDYLAIGIHELSSISERRIERLVNPSLSELPAFLVADGGFNSGFMMAHCTAAALVSESKTLCHPSSVDSLSTSAATEDHVSMGGWAARKALRVVEHVEQVLAIELLASCQALEFLRPLRTTDPLEKVYDLLRSVVSPWNKDRCMSPDIEAAHTLLQEQKVWEAVQPYMDKYSKKMETN